MSQLPGFEDPVRSTDDLLAESVEIMERVTADHEPSRRFLLFSGGNDSLVLLDSMARFADEIVHVNTGIGIPETEAFAERTAARYDLPYTVLTPPKPYEWHVLREPFIDRKGNLSRGWDGLPGPGAHLFTYTSLKERCIEALLRHHRQFRGERFFLLTGARKAESVRRMGTSEVVRRDGGQVWVNPLHEWPNDNMRDYRAGESLPVNEVSVHLHMSGECLCGAMASQGPEREERAQIRFFYPEFDQRLNALEKQCRDTGKTYCEWGVKRGVDKTAGPMCQSCEARQPQLFAPTPDPEEGR